MRNIFWILIIILYAFSSCSTQDKAVLTSENEEISKEAITDTPKKEFPTEIPEKQASDKNENVEELKDNLTEDADKADPADPSFAESGLTGRSGKQKTDSINNPESVKNVLITDEADKTAALPISVKEKTAGSLPLEDSMKRVPVKRWAKKISDINPDPAESAGDNNLSEKTTEEQTDSPGKDNSFVNAAAAGSKNGSDEDPGISDENTEPVKNKLENSSNSSAELSVKPLSEDPADVKEIKGKSSTGADKAKSADSKSSPSDYESKAGAFINALKDEPVMVSPSADSLKKDFSNDSDMQRSSEKDPYSSSVKPEKTEPAVNPDTVSVEGSSEAVKTAVNSDNKSGSKGKNVEVPPSLKRETVLFEDPSHIVVILDSLGWIYLGEGESSGEIELLSRSLTDDSTVFSFKAGKGRFFVLNFQQQNTDGSSRAAEIELKEKDAENAGDNEAVELISSSQKDSSDNLDSDADNSLNDIINIENSGKLFEDALDLIENGKYGEAAVVLEKIRKSSSQFVELDRLYFLLGQSYEKNENNRDPVEAEKYYSMILDQFPFSLYYDRAEIRKRYLQKYFINIR